MNRELTESYLQSLSDEDYRLLLSEQFEMFRRLNQQANNIIRMIIAGVGVVTGIVGFQIFVRTNMISELHWTLNHAISNYGMSKTLVLNSFYAAPLAVVLTFGLLFLSIAKAVGVLTMEGPLPLTRHKSLNEDATGPEEKPLRQWISINDTRLVEAERKVQQSYIDIWGAITMGFITLFLVLGILGGFPEILRLIHTGLFLLGPAIGWVYSKGVITALVNTGRDGGIRAGLSDALDAFGDIHLHKGFDPVVKTFLIIVYGTLYTYSAPIVAEWLPIF